jgi:hypothetical protein
MPLQGTLNELNNLNLFGMATPQLNGGLAGGSFPNIFGMNDPTQPLRQRPPKPPRPPRPGPGPGPGPGGGGQLDECNTRCLRPNGQFDFDCWKDCIEDTGKPDPGVPDLGGGGNGPPGGGGGGGTPSFNSNFLSDILSRLSNLGNFTDNPLMQQLQAFLSKALEGPFGIDEDVLRRSQNAIRGAGANREQVALQNLAAQLNTVGQLGGGRQIELSRQVSQDTSRQVSDQLGQLSLQDALFANESRGQILQSILGFGSQLGQGGAQEIQKLLGISDIELRRMLGEGGLRLGQGQLDLQQQQFLFQMALQQLLGQLGLLGLG